jgi:Zn-dependent protease
MLGWSINLFRIFGIQLAVHATFFLLLAYAAYEGWLSGGLPGLVWRVLLTVSLFICVVLHELGHSLTAKRYGVHVPRILLLPIGGMAEMDHIPRRPSAEFLITIAGPSVNFAIVAVLLPFTWRYVLGVEEMVEFSGIELLTYLFLLNLYMGIFNLLPVYPMDGGRILRSILALWLPYLQATWWAVMTTRVLAPILALIGVLFLDSWMMGVLFVFILITGNAEYRQLRRREEEAAYWADMARRVVVPSAGPGEAPLLPHGPN